MTVGQLWFGWTARGAEGFNKQQIIAGSGVLDDRRERETQLALQYCYRADEPAFGWAEDDGLRFVFQRLPAGLDGYGRPGNYFVQVLVAAAGTLPAEVLGRLWGAEVWQTLPLPETPAKLRAFENLSDLGLRPKTEASRGLLLPALAGHLRNVADGRGSRLEMDLQDAVCIAAEVAELLPERFGLPAFSTREDGDRARRYDLVVGESAGGDLAPAGLDHDPGDTWTTAAELLVRAHEDLLVRDATEAVVESSATLTEFADRLHDLAAAVSDNADDQIDPSVLRLVASDERLLRFVMDTAGRVRVEMAFRHGDPDAVSMLARASQLASGSPDPGRLVNVLRDLPPGEALARVLELRIGAVDLARRTTSALLDDWASAGRVGALTASQARRFLELLSEPQTTTGPGIGILLDEPRFTADILASRSIRPDWQARATARHPERVHASALARAIAEAPEFARSLLVEPSPALLARVGEAIASAPLHLADAVLSTAAPKVDSSFSDEWRISHLLRTRDPLPRYEEARLLLARRQRSTEAWAEMALDAYVASVLGMRSSRRGLPDLSEAIIRGVVGVRVSLWSDFRSELYDQWLRPTLLERASHNAGQIVTRMQRADRDAALELAVDVLASHAVDGWQAWSRAVSELRLASGVPYDDLARRVVRAAHRETLRWPDDYALGVIPWVAARVDSSRISPELLTTSGFQALGNALRDERQLATLAALRAAFKKSRPLKRWLGDLSSALEDRIKAREQRKRRR